MKEQHFQKFEVFHAFYFLIFSYTCKNKQNLKVSETPALAIISPSVQKVFPLKASSSVSRQVSLAQDCNLLLVL